MFGFQQILQFYWFQSAICIAEYKSTIHHPVTIYACNVMTVQLNSPHRHGTGKFPWETEVKVILQTYGEGFAINLHALSRLSVWCWATENYGLWIPGLGSVQRHGCTERERESFAWTLDKIAIGIWIALSSRAKPNMTDAGRLCCSSAFCLAAIPFQEHCLLFASHWHGRDLDLFILESITDTLVEWQEPQVLICSRDRRKGGQKDWLDPKINLPRHSTQTPTKGLLKSFCRLIRHMWRHTLRFLCSLSGCSHKAQHLSGKWLKTEPISALIAPNQVCLVGDKYYLACSTWSSTS